jgi:HAE1 family hydrophobic/amphiphilic exporter-1
LTKIYSSPLRVYLCLGFLALVGIYSGLQLPISLFPNSSKPKIHVGISYGSSTAEEFLNTYGRHLEDRFKEITAGSVEVERVYASYDTQNVGYDVEFKWGTSGREALKEVQLVAASFSGQFPQEVRDSVHIYMRNEGTGFLVVSFYSNTRSLDEIYKYLEPILTPAASKAQDAASVDLWNPSKKEIQIQLIPEKMAALQLFPRDVANSVSQAIFGNSGGSVKVGINSLDIQMPRQVKAIEELGGVLVSTPSGHFVRLSDIATIDLGEPSSNDRSFKTSGAPSLILFAEPRPGGNIKRMAEEILHEVEVLAPTFPKDIKYKVLVDPSEFIRNSVSNVFREVCLAALLAVGVLFLFIGNIKNVVTAAIEIPMSIVLAFILMRMTGINLNLISLGGLALSAGMNVDASVVVMENIFRHFEEAKGKLNLSYQDKIKILTAAVAEVRFPVIASTIASLVVFIPLAFTSELSNAILGDLALAVVFSHGFSALVALILVPTVRLQVMSLGGSSSGHSPIEKYLKKLEEKYKQALAGFMNRRLLKTLTYCGAAVALVILFFTVIPRLPKEIVGTPDTDWIILEINTQGNNLTRQMASQAGEEEARLMKKFGDHIAYTFTEIYNPGYSDIMARLKDKSEMQKIWKELQQEFHNTPTTNFDVSPWNPSELPIPNPPQMRIVIRGAEASDRVKVAREVYDLVRQKKYFPNQWTTPQISRKETIVMRPHLEQWSLLQNGASKLSSSDIADMSRVATAGRRLGYLPIEGTLVPIVLQFPESRVSSLEDLSSFPIGISGKLIPMKALMTLSLEEISPITYREDRRELIVINGKMDRGDETQAPTQLKKAEKDVDAWQAAQKMHNGASVTFEDAQKELTSALHQLGFAVGISILLIFIVMVLQFGNIMNAAIVLVAIPLGFIGVLLSLFIFKSTLSLNSALGVILLNGIVVANSIMLVDFMRRLVEKGLSPRDAALEAAQKRLRPILMTSLTTGLGMLPIAIGLGEGGRILQPLGIAVTGGLLISVFLTLFIVPSLQVSYLDFKNRGRR